MVRYFAREFDEYKKKYNLQSFMVLQIYSILKKKKKSIFLYLKN